MRLFSFSAGRLAQTGSLFYRVCARQETRRAADDINAVAIKASATKYEADIAEILQCLLKSSPRVVISITALPQHRHPGVWFEWDGEFRATLLELEA